MPRLPAVSPTLAWLINGLIPPVMVLHGVTTRGSAWLYVQLHTFLILMLGILACCGGTQWVACKYGARLQPTKPHAFVHTDINLAMLREGRNRLTDQGKLLPTTVCDAEQLPFTNDRFDLVCVAFGLRNMTHKDRALREMARVLKPGGKLMVLEFSKVAPPLTKLYDWYSFQVLPRLGKMVAGDDASYRYLAESIRMHPDQSTLKALMQQNGFAHVDIHNLSLGVVALHVGIKC